METTVSLFQQYVAVLDQRAPMFGRPGQTTVAWVDYWEKLHGCSRDLALEVLVRLEQMDFILRRVRTIDAANRESCAEMERIKKAHPDISRSADFPPAECSAFESAAAESSAATFELRLLTEAFYWFGHRAIRMARRLPKLSSLTCNEIRAARVHLLEHAGESSKVTNQSFGFGGETGPILKPIRRPGRNEFRDLGLYANAEALKSNLEPLLRAAIA